MVDMVNTRLKSVDLSHMIGGFKAKREREPRITFAYKNFYVRSTASGERQAKYQEQLRTVVRHTNGLQNNEHFSKLVAYM